MDKSDAFWHQFEKIEPNFAIIKSKFPYDSIYSFFSHYRSHDSIASD